MRSDRVDVAGTKIGTGIEAMVEARVGTGVGTRVGATLRAARTILLFAVVPAVVPAFGGSRAAVAQSAGQTLRVTPNGTMTQPDPRDAVMDPRTGSPIAGKVGTMPKPAYPTSARDVRTFTTEVVYNFAHYDYTPAIVLQPVSKAGANQTTPEGACVAILSAMQQKDYEWFLSLWDKKSGTDIRELDLENNAVEQTKKDWQSMFGGKRVEIAERIESGLYVALIFRAYQPGVAQPSLSTAMVFKLESGKWVATNEAEMTNAFVILHEGKTSKTSLRGFLTPLVNGTGYLDSGEPNPEDVAQTEFLRQYPKGKTEVTHVMQ